MAKTTISHVSDTAIWMAAYRVHETERPDALFRDPLAKVLVGDRGEAITQLLSAYARYASWGLVMRTLVIDEFLAQAFASGVKTVINLGAGLDTRPYRLELPADVHWIEIDFPDVIEMKNAKLQQEKPRCRLERIGLDLADRTERRRAFAELNARITDAVVLTEGVIPYLSEDIVAELATDLHALSQVRCWVTEYYSPQIYARFQSDAFQKRLGNSPFRFFPHDWFGFFQNQGWRKRDLRYLYDEGEKRGRGFPHLWWVRLLKPLIGAEKFASLHRLQAYTVLEKT